MDPPQVQSIKNQNSHNNLILLSGPPTTPPDHFHSRLLFVRITGLLGSSAGDHPVLCLLVGAGGGGGGGRERVRMFKF